MSESRTAYRTVPLRRAPAGAKPTEAQFQRQVTDLAEQLGWDWYHTHDARRSPAGFPDLVLICPPRVLFLELKGYDRRGRLGVLSLEQAAWLEQLRACGLQAGCYQPEQLEEIAGLMREGQ